MSKSLLVLGSSAGVAGCAGVAGLVYGKSTTGVSFKDRFTKEIKGKILLEVDSGKHDSVGEELVKEYKASHPDRPDVEGLDNTNLNKEQLKDRCKKEASSKETVRFDAYVEGCSRNTLRTQFNDKVSNKIWIDSKEEGDWAEKVTGYPENNNNNLQIPQSGTSGAVAKNQVTSRNIMDGCFPKADISFVNGEDADYKRAEALCTK